MKNEPQKRPNEAKRDFFNLVNNLNLSRPIIHDILRAFDRCFEAKTNLPVSVKINLVIDETGFWIPVGRGFRPLHTLE